MLTICRAFLWDWYCVICRPTCSQCPSYIFSNFCWFANELGSFEKLLDLGKNSGSQLRLAAFYATVGLAKLLIVRTSGKGIGT